MLTEAFIEALLVDEEVADQIWEVWDAGEIDDDAAKLVWLQIRARDTRYRNYTYRH